MKMGKRNENSESIMNCIACVIVWSLVISANGQATDLFISVNPETNMLVDCLGRERFFHGTNVVQKDPPYYPEDDFFAEADMQRLQSLGLNTIRLGINNFCYFLFGVRYVLSLIHI